MITPLQSGNFPAIERPAQAAQRIGNPTLTEVVSEALYGMPMLPGCEADSLRTALAPLCLEGWALWNDPNGPAWLVPHLKLLADGATWPFAQDTDDDNERITLGWYQAARRWLTIKRRMGFAFGLPAQLSERVIALANMTEAQAINAAIDEAQRISSAESAINAEAERFYALLSRAIAAGRITLKGIRTNPETSTWLPLHEGAPPHSPIPVDYFELPMIHNVFDNELEPDRFGSKAKAFASVFDRRERQNEKQQIKWTDVKVPTDQAAWLLSVFRGARNPIVESPISGDGQSGEITLGFRSTPIDPIELESWPLANALAWIRAVRRDMTEEERNDFVRRAYRQDAEAFPAGDPPLEEGRILLDKAATDPDRVILRASNGAIDRHQLGPHAVIMMTRGALDRPSFAIWPRLHVDIDSKLVDVWCLSVEIRECWPAPGYATPKSPRRTIVAETECREWLTKLMKSSPNERTKTRPELYREACQKFPGIGPATNKTPSQSFDRAWNAAIDAANVRTVWGHAGRPRKSQR